MHTKDPTTVCPSCAYACGIPAKKLQEAAAWVRSRFEKERLGSFRFTGLVGSKGAIGFVGTGVLILAAHTKSIFARELGKEN